MRDRLEIVERVDGYRIYWLLGESGDYGAALGPWTGASAEIVGDEEDREHEVACKAARRFLDPDLDLIVSCEYVFNSKRGAERVIRATRQAIREFHEGKPWPAWARKAVENGWKAPRGWKP